MYDFKIKVKNSFNLSSTTYDMVANVQKNAASSLVDFLKVNLPTFYPKTILDLGTGTGNVIESLAKIFPNSKYTINDISENMIKLATKKFQHVIDMKPYIGDLESITFDNHDLYISNFALQWVNNLEESIKNLYKKTNVFAFTCLLQGTFRELWEYINKQCCMNTPVPKYPSLEELNSFLRSLQSKKQCTYVKNYPLNFKNIKEFLKYLKLLGAKINKVENTNNLKKLILNDNPFNTSYNVMFVVLKKE